MPVRDIARPDTVTARPDDSVATVAAKMRDENVGSVVVVEDGSPVGIVTDRDLAVRTLADGVGPDGHTTADVMTGDPCCVDADAGVFELTEAMREHSVRRIPVVDGDRLEGIVTLDDLNTLFADEQRNLSAVVRSESPPY
ncbi:MAG: CBS domain-containing protein [Halobacterium sp.]